MARKSWMNVVMKAALITGGVALYVFVETGTRDQLSRMEDKIDRVEIRMEERIDRVETKLSTRIDRVETKLSTRIDRVETKLSARIDRVETKIDEIIGYLKYRFEAGPEDSAPSGMKE